MHSTPVNGFGAMAIPDFIAGLVYGWTGDNQLTLIEGCYEGGADIVGDVEDFIGHIKNVDIVRAGIDVSHIFKDVKDSVHDCPSSVMYDVKALEEWASIFTDPKRLTKTISKNFLLHKRSIFDLIHAEGEDWANDEWFQAGVDVASIFVKLVGPVYPSPSIFDFEDMAVPDFIAGFIYGFTGDNQLERIEGCFEGSTSMYVNIRVGIDDITKDGANWIDYTDAAFNFGEAALEIPRALASCRRIGGDIAEIEEWAQIFKPENRTKLIAQVTKHMAFHKNEIIADLAEVKADWASANYFDSGKAAADALTLAVGPVNK